MTATGENWLHKKRLITGLITVSLDKVKEFQILLKCLTLIYIPNETAEVIGR